MGAGLHTNGQAGLTEGVAATTWGSKPAWKQHQSDLTLGVHTSCSTGLGVGWALGSNSASTVTDYVTRLKFSLPLESLLVTRV